MWVDPALAGAVVVGCDRSWESQNAVVAATCEASRRGCELVLIAVVETQHFWPDGLAWARRIEADARLEAQAATDLALAKVVAADPAVPVRTLIMKDLASPELADLVRQAGLLVVGRHGARGQGGFSLGTRSAELARDFHSPILVIHEEGRPSRGRFVPEGAVFAGMDTIGGADAVLSVAVSEAVLRGVSLYVVHAVPHGKDVEPIVIEKGWRRCLATLKEAQFPADVPARLVITQDDPVRALLHRVAPGDLLVVGTRGQGRLAGPVNGSVSMQILDQMTCDVLLIPQSSAAPVTVPPEPVHLASPALSR
jgi:nucleotide-binding universal stress UspA family protein